MSDAAKDGGSRLYYSPFAAGEEVCCAWGGNLSQTNLEFLNGVDHEYFKYVAQIHSAALAGKDKHRAAVALRTAYHQGLETLFSLIFAGLQAPDCIPGWIIKCNKPGELRRLVAALSAKEQKILIKPNLPEFSWLGVSNWSNGTLFQKATDKDQIVGRFAELWRRFADDFTDEFLLAEHNSIKHGFRVKLGGLSLSFSPEGDKNTKPPDSSYISLGASEMGSFFFLGDGIMNSPLPTKKDPHFRLKHCHVNSHPEFTVTALNLISVSIWNVVSLLKIVNGHRKGVQYFNLSAPNIVEETWNKRTGLMQLTADETIDEADITRFTRDEIIEKIRAHKSQNG